MRIQVTPAGQDDYDSCARLMSSSEPWITLQRDLDGCRATLLREGTELFIARDEQGAFLGFILLAPHGLASSPYIACFAVTAEARGRGVGAHLLRFAEERYHDRRNLFLLVSSFNTRAQQFYRRHGFECVGELKEYLVSGHSELIFHKRLP
jgi:[ribosomal protein S18]-alanine N-acetyltransferase